MTVFHNYPILVPVAAGLTVEVGKLFIALLRKRSLGIRDILQTGGMPSGHSAFVTALTVTMYLLFGIGSPEFTLASAFAILVMYDALKLRRAAGSHAAALNLLVQEKRYNERLGHTPSEVVVGIFLGLIIPFVLLWDTVDEKLPLELFMGNLSF